MADEYRLTIPADLAERVEMVGPDGNQGTGESPHQYIDQPLHQPTSRYLNSAVTVENVPAEPPVENPDSSSNGSGRPSGLSDEQWDEIRWLADAQKNLTGAKAKRQ